MIQTKNPDAEKPKAVKEISPVRDDFIKKFSDYLDRGDDKRETIEQIFREFKETIPKFYTEAGLREGLEDLQHIAESLRKEPPKKITAYVGTDNQVRLEIDNVKEAYPLNTLRGKAQLRSLLKQYGDYRIISPDNPTDSRRFPFFKRNITTEELIGELELKVWKRKRYLLICKISYKIKLYCK